MAQNVTLEPIPAGNPLVDRDGLMTPPYQRWFSLALIPRVQSAAFNVVSLGLTAQAASIGTTAFIPSASGLYRVTYYVRVTQAATTSSSLQVGVLSTDGGVAITQTSVALTTNTTASVQGGVVIAQCDPSTPLSYSTTYASVGGTPMQYRLLLVGERL